MIQRPEHNSEDQPLLKKWREAITQNINLLLTFKTTVTAWMLTRNIGASTELTIASGVITKTSYNHTIDTEANAATDDLDTINGGTNGDLLYLSADNTARTVVVKNGTGNIRCGTDMSLDSAEDTMVLRYNGTLSVWVEISRANNA